MGNQQDLQVENSRLLRKVHARFVLRLSFLNALRWAFVGGLAAVFFLLLSKFFIISPLYLYVVTGTAFVVSFLSGLFAVLLRPASVLKTAAVVDNAAGTKETISTWFENSSSGRDSVFDGLLAEKASVCLKNLSESRVNSCISLRACRLRFLSVMLFALIIYMIPPFMRINTSSANENGIVSVSDPAIQRKIEQHELKMKKLSQFSKDDAKRDTAEEISNLFNKLRKDGVEKKEFLAKFSELTGELKKELESARKEDAASTEKALGDLKDKMEALKEELKTVEELEDRKKLDVEMEELMKELASALEDGDLADALEKLAEADGSGELGELLDNLKDALENADAGECSGKLAKLLKKLQAIAGEEGNGDEEDIAELEDLLESMELLGECEGGGNCKGKTAGLRDLIAKVKLGSTHRGGGTTDEDIGRGTKATMGDGHDEGGKTANTVQEYKELYAPKEIDAGYEDTRVKGRLEPGKSAPYVIRYFRGDPDKNRDAHVPIEDVLPKYLEDAEKSLAEEEIPSEYKETIRKYFESLRK